ncbi:PTS sugar transporter subunit IIA [Moellerella wisconsensis]|uniref:PTS sugar transporter subunit IIA n=2 Tax=Moellerella wisconsensis TaxID=158849 RepID=A0ACD3Y4X5_9GAMM|nr:PTS sugar transporter subunit IIA [Moellerella wisconsensis]UNH23471.1 PTS sugar transporter subunit IIA [Moellerella wisconsensis]UNH26551.1 PTS sugar transporter subunit IIA [Moellerella wisconsensis]UNH29967.1 PTS sugar transporter subunit IIA [Moellerella wisconsensis]UNH38192.1 PTS sugar transporter subunit IIA [Moellerella wisconsensis]WJW81201.1 PTS sugar transporter subunit IIA [Moellerella wisconsensis]
MLKTLLTADVIQVLPSATNWRDAVTQSCQPLINNGSVQPQYVEAIIQSHEAIGPYYVLGPGIAMPHARPENGVNKLSLGLTVIQHGVNFDADENDPIKLLFVLAATDSDSHVGAIAQLAELFDNQEDIDQLINAATVDDVLAVISKY